MSIGPSNDQSSEQEPRFGVASVGSGVLAILLVVLEYQILMYGWSGHESSILGFFFLLIPPVTIGLAVSGISFGKKGLQEEGFHRTLASFGIMISFVPFFLCCLLFGFFCVASGGLMGL